MNLVEHIRPGDTVVIGQACAEPLSLTESLTAQRAELGGIRCFLGIQLAGTFAPEHSDHLELVSYCGTGANRALAKAGVLDIYPGHYSTLPWFVSEGPLRADVVLVQCSAPDDRGRYSLGLADDYLSAAIDAARVVIAESNDQVPFTPSARLVTADDIDVLVETSRSPVESAPVTSDPVTECIAATVAGLISDGATLQFGIGVLPELVLRRLHDRRDLRVHSGLLNDAVVDLHDAGALRAAAVGALLIGSRRLFAFADSNPAVSLQPASYTHNLDVLRELEQFVAINSAVEVDLTGQVNAEVAAGQYVGAVGGGPEFLRAAARSPGGTPIVALPASRIVAQLSGPVSTARCDAGVFITEYGVADLRGLTLRQRTKAMLAIADPERRNMLEEKV
jgi:acyl-CoA hydrolase